MQFVRINGMTIHHRVVRSDGGKPVLVFINSLGTDFRIWQGIEARLASHYGLVFYDKRGHGLSDVGETPCTIEDHVSDLDWLLDHLALRQVIVCGLSVGGLIAQGLHARHPEKVKALILCDTAHRIGDPETWNSRIAAVEAHGLGHIVQAVMERWFTSAFRSPDNAAYGGYCNMLMRQPVAGYTGTCAAIRDADFTTTARRIAVPTLCIVGEQDGSTPPVLVQSLAALIPGARFETIAGAGHIPCVEQPDAFAALLRAFIEQLPTGDTCHG